MFFNIVPHNPFPPPPDCNTDKSCFKLPEKAVFNKKNLTTTTDFCQSP